MSLEVTRFIPILLILLLSACGFNEKVVTAEVVQGERPVVSRATMPPKPQISNLEFRVVTDENLKEYIAYLNGIQGDFVFFALTPKDYENLSLNISDILRYQKSLKAIIRYYEGFLYQDVLKNSNLSPNGE
jgi:hypothetical protein